MLNIRALRILPASLLIISTVLLTSCPDPVGPAPEIRVTTATTGESMDPDGYIVTLDGSTSEPISVNGTVTFSNLTTGSHTVQLGGAAHSSASQG